MVAHYGDVDLPPFCISGGAAKVTPEFKYLGSWFAQDGRMDKEIGFRNGRALGTFHSFDKVWANKKLRLSTKMAVYMSFVLPHFLYGCESWVATAAQMCVLEHSHSQCLRRILGIELRGHHRLTYIREACGCGSLEIMIAKRSLQWLGHIARMSAARYPRMAFDCSVAGAFRSVGRPRFAPRHAFGGLLRRTRLVPPAARTADWTTISDAAFVCAQDKQGWRSAVRALESFEVPPDPGPARVSSRERVPIMRYGAFQSH